MYTAMILHGPLCSPSLHTTAACGAGTNTDEAGVSSRLQAAGISFRQPRVAQQLCGTPTVPGFRFKALCQKVAPKL